MYKESQEYDCHTFDTLLDWREHMGIVLILDMLNFLSN